MKFGGESNSEMIERIRYHPMFDCDVREAAGWYDNRSPGLGDAFVELVRLKVDEVIASPEQFARAPSGCRFVRIPRFSYVLLFDVQDKEILFLGVLHTARSMEKWRERQGDF